MPDLLTCVTLLAKILTLGWSLGSWVAVAFELRQAEPTFNLSDSLGVMLGTPIFVGLMGWLD